MAISIGNIHRLTSHQSGIDFDRLADIESAVPEDMALVLHGASGITPNDMHQLVQHRIAKVNFGTVLRQAMRHTLQATLQDMPDELDRPIYMKPAIQAVKDAAIDAYALLGHGVTSQEP